MTTPNGNSDRRKPKFVTEQIQLVWPYDDTYYVVCRMEPWVYRNLLLMIREGMTKKEAITASVINGSGVSLFLTKRTPKQLAEDGLKQFDRVNTSRFLDDVNAIQKLHASEPEETVDDEKTD